MCIVRISFHLWELFLIFLRCYNFILRIEAITLRNGYDSFFFLISAIIMIAYLNTINEIDVDLLVPYRTPGFC